MIGTVEAIVDEHGRVRLLEELRLPEPRRALVTILEEGLRTDVSEMALLSEPALAQDCERPEEDEAWSHLQSGNSSDGMSMTHGELGGIPPNSALNLTWPRRLTPIR
jgi:hypothetical protein